MIEAIPRPQDKRRHPRFKTSLRGRYMLASREEFACTIIDVSVGGVAITGPERGAIGEPVIVYMEELGRIEGEIVRYIDDGFALRLTITTSATEKYARRLDDLQAGAAGRQNLDRRREPRVKLGDEVAAIGPSGPLACEIIDLSLTGANIKIDPRPAIGALVQLGRVRGRVVRHSVSGVGIEFIEAAEGALNQRLVQIVLPHRRAGEAAA